MPLAAIRVARTFRTVRYETAVLLAGLVPICRAVAEDTRVHSRRGTGVSSRELRKEERQRTIEEWQTTWDADAAADNASRYVRWAHLVIPDVGAWQLRNHGEVTFHLSQVLSGHGFFREYPNKMRFTSSPACPRCPGVVQGVEHVMSSNVECPRFAEVRSELLDGVLPETLEAHMLQSPTNWPTYARPPSASPQNSNAAGTRNAPFSPHRPCWRNPPIGSTPKQSGVPGMTYEM